MSAIGEILEKDDLPRLSRLLSGVGVDLPRGDVEAADVLRGELERLDRREWKPRLGRMLTIRLTGLAGLPRAWTTLEEEEAWNAVVLAGVADRDPEVLQALLRVEEHLREFAPAIRRDFPAQIDRALTRCQRGSQLLQRWRAVLASSHDPVVLFRAFVGLIWARDRELDAEEDAPLSLIREGLTTLERQLADRPDRDRWLAQAMTSVESTYPAPTGQWPAKLHDIVSHWSPAAGRGVASGHKPARGEKAERRPKVMSKADLIEKLAAACDQKVGRKDVFVVIKRSPKEREGINPFTKERIVFKAKRPKKVSRRTGSSNRGKSAT